MMKLERKGDGPIRFVIHCIHPQAFEVVEAALSCFGWGHPVGQKEEFALAQAVVSGDHKMSPDEQIYIIGGPEDEQ